MNRTLFRTPNCFTQCTTGRHASTAQPSTVPPQLMAASERSTGPPPETTASLHGLQDRNMIRFSDPAPRLLTALFVSLCIVGITVPATTAADTSNAWQWPLDPAPEVSREFNPPPEEWASGHRGVDLRTAPGTEVLSPEHGRVVFVGTVVDRSVLTVDHGNGVLSSFEPIIASVAEGDQVSRGELLGTAASGGHCGTFCVHWGVRVHGEYMDPLDFITDQRPSVLLPLPG